MGYLCHYKKSVKSKDESNTVNTDANLGNGQRKKAVSKNACGVERGNVL